MARQAEVWDGRVLAGRLRLDRRLAVGAMGEVWLARHLGLDKDVAVKILRTDKPLNDELIQRFIREARTASRLDHPNSVSVLDFGQDMSGPLYLAMELLEGQTLRDTLKHQGKLPLGEACRFMSQVLAGLAAAHSAGILHRDIKPSNIMLVPKLDDDGNPITLAKVCDFGLATFSNQNEPLRGTERQLVGTPLYMSPEQAVNDPTDERSDIYACGVVLFEMLTGRPPFEADNAIAVLMKHCAHPVPKPSISDHLPVDVDKVIFRAMDKAPSLRYQTAREFRAAVLHLTQNNPAQTTDELALSTVDTTKTRTHAGETNLNGLRHKNVTQPTSMVHAPRRSDFSVTQPQLPSALITTELIPSPRNPPPSKSRSIPSTRLSNANVLIDTSYEYIPSTRPSNDMDSSPIPSIRVGEVARIKAPSPSLNIPIEKPVEKASALNPNHRALITDAKFLWERYALSPFRRPPPRGFWLLDGEGHRLGPLTFDEIALALRLEAHESSLSKSYVAADPRPNIWHPANTFLHIADATGINQLNPPPPTKIKAKSRLTPSTLPALFAVATREKMTGRIIISTSQSAKTSFYEIYLLAGQPTSIKTNDLSLQTPSIWIERNIILEHDFPHLVSDAWLCKRSVVDSARYLVGLDLVEQRNEVMQTRLRRILQTQLGTWVVDIGFIPPRRQPFANSLLTILPRLARESTPNSAIEAVLKPYLKHTLSALPVAHRAVEELGFTSSERAIAEEIIAAPQLEISFPKQPELRRTYTTIAYLLLATTQSPAPTKSSYRKRQLN